MNNFTAYVCSKVWSVDIYILTILIVRASFKTENIGEISKMAHTKTINSFLSPRPP